MTAQLSREIVENLLQHNDESDSPANAEAWEVNALCRLALAGMDSKPVAYLFWPENDETSGFIVNSDEDPAHKPGEADSRGIRWISSPLYAAPPAPVAVPDDATPENVEILASTYAPRGITYQWDRDECNAAADSWNTCRAAMLKAGPVTAATVPDGWAANADANDALVMLDRIDTVDCDDDERIESVKNIIRRLAAAPVFGNCRENENSSTNNFRENAETSTKRSREHFISLCNRFWNWQEFDQINAGDEEPRLGWDGKEFTHRVTQALWRMYQAAPEQEV